METVQERNAVQEELDFILDEIVCIKDVMTLMKSRLDDNHSHVEELGQISGAMGQQIRNLHMVVERAHELSRQLTRQ